MCQRWDTSSAVSFGYFATRGLARPLRVYAANPIP